MRLALAVTVATALATAATASAAGPRFHYERLLVAHGAGPYRVAPDAALTGHTRSGYADMRVFDSRGGRVAWRFLPVRASRQVPWPARKVTRTERGSRTVVRVDLGFLLPIESIVVEAATEAYDRPVLVEASLDGKSFWWANRSRIYRYPGARRATLAVDPAGTQRFVRVTIDNGDDRALQAIRVRVLRAPITLLVAGGGALPYTVRYGVARLHAPDYDFARLPLKALGAGHASVARLGSERRIAVPARPEKRSYHWAVLAGLALAAVVIGACGFVVVRRKTPT
jgi:hypothetical protein